MNSKEISEQQLRNQIDKAQVQLDKQRDAIELILNDLKDKEHQVNMLSEKRMDI